MPDFLSVTCPCCGKLLEIDASSGKVISCKEKKSLGSLDEFLEKQKHRSDELDALFSASKEKAEHRLEEIDKKFEAMKKRSDLKDPPPSIQWD